MNSRPGLLPLHDAFVGVENDQGRQVPFVGDADGVAVPVDLARDNVLAGRGTNGSNHVAMLGSDLVGLRLGRCFHVSDQLLQQRCSIAIEHPTNGFDPLIVARSVDARAGTQADVHREATLGEQFLAVANAKLPAEQLHDLFGCPGVGKGPPLLCRLGRATGVHDAGVLLVGHGQVREGFPVLEHGIEPRHVLANQLPLKDKRRLRGLRHDALDVVGSGNEFGNHVAVGVAGKVGTNALVESCRLADVEHPSLCILEQVDARFVWQVGRSQIHGHAPTTPAMTQKANPVSLQTHRWGCLMKEAAEPFLSLAC